MNIGLYRDNGKENGNYYNGFIGYKNSSPLTPNSAVMLGNISKP